MLCWVSLMGSDVDSPGFLENCTAGHGGGAGKMASHHHRVGTRTLAMGQLDSGRSTPR